MKNLIETLKEKKEDIRDYIRYNSPVEIILVFGLQLMLVGTAAVVIGALFGFIHK